MRNLSGTDVLGRALGGAGAAGNFLNNWGSLIGAGAGLISSNMQPDSLTGTSGGTSDSVSSFTPDPAFAQYAQGGLSQLGNLPPYQVAPMGGLFGQASDALGRELSGQNVNPYLNTAFNAAADATQNRLSSEFARSGRNLGAAQPARSQELQHLAAGIYGPGYEAERQRQYGAIPQAALMGQQQQLYGQMQADAPYTNLARYSSALQGLYPFFPGSQRQQTSQTGSVTQPLFNNPMAGLLGGAMLGQQLFGGYR
jgi:hypothetical protein